MDSIAVAPPELFRPDIERRTDRFYKARFSPCERCLYRMKKWQPTKTGTIPVCEEDTGGSTKCTWCQKFSGKPCLKPSGAVEVSSRELARVLRSVRRDGYDQWKDKLEAAQSSVKAALQKKRNLKRAPTEKRDAAEASEASSYRQEKLKLVERSVCAFEGALQILQSHSSAQRDHNSAVEARQTEISTYLENLVTLQKEHLEMYSKINEQSLREEDADEYDAEHDG